MFPLKDWSSVRFDKKFSANSDYKVFNEKMKIVKNAFPEGDISSPIARTAISLAAVDLIKTLLEKRLLNLFNH